MLFSIGNTYKAESQYQEALDAYQEGLEAQKISCGRQHSHVSLFLEKIAEVYKAQKKHEEALKYYQETLVIQKAIYTDNNPEIVETLKNIDSVTGELQTRRSPEPLLFSKPTTNTNETENTLIIEEVELNRGNRYCTILQVYNFSHSRNYRERQFPLNLDNSIEWRTLKANPFHRTPY